MLQVQSQFVLNATFDELIFGMYILIMYPQPHWSICAKKKTKKQKPVRFVSIV